MKLIRMMGMEMGMEMEMGMGMEIRLLDTLTTKVDFMCTNGDLADDPV